VGITERAAHRIVDELVEGGYISRKRQGRRSHYDVKTQLPLRDPLLRDRKLAHLLELFAGSDGHGAGKRGVKGKIGPSDPADG
jgi:hypothetical protein